jgi:hypothetical protein
MPGQSSTLRTLAVMGLGGLALFAWWLVRNGEHTRVQETAVGTQDHSRAPGVDDELVSTAPPLDREGVRVADQPDDQQIDSRSAAPIVALEGRVLDTSGAPIGNALVTWTSIDLQTALPILPTTAEGRATEADASVTTQSLSDGRFVFESLPRIARASSVVWATAAGMEGDAVLVVLPKQLPLEIRLSPGNKRIVRVLDAAGAPVAGASVEQYCFGALDRAYSDPWKVAAARAFRRVSVTDAQGHPAVPFYSSNGGERIRAWYGGISTETWREALVDDGATIELVLSPSFSCYGAVTCTNPEIDLSRLVIDAWAMGERPSGSMSAIEVRGDGSWGPLHVPVREGWEYSLSLNGPGIASDEAAIGRPSAGESIRRDFHAEAELRVPLRVINDQGAPIAGAQCLAYWENASSGVASHGTSDSEGFVELLGVRPGWVQLSAEAKGHSNFQGEWLELVAPTEEPLEIKLAPARQVQGRVVREGEPVESFKIIWWTADSVRSSQTWEFDVEGNEDGVFELQSAPRETVWLMASAEGSSRSGFMRSEVDSEGDVVLDLLPSCRATGRVVDARTGEAIGGASVQLYMNRGNQYLQPRHAPVVADAEGRFAVEGLAPGDNRLVIEAPGYSRYLGVAFGAPERVTDIGAVPMQSTREFALVLVGDAPVDTSAYAARLKGTRYHGPIGFDAEGVALFEDVSPGITTWTVSGPNGFQRSEVHALQPDADWVFEVEVDSGPTLEIEVVSPTDAPLPRGLVLSVSGAEPRGPRTPGAEAWFSVNVDDEGRAQVHGLRPGPVAVLAIDEAGNTGAAAHGVLELGGSRIEVLWKPRVQNFRVLDPAGRPVQEVDVFLCAPEGESTWTTMDATDDNGEVSFELLPYDDLLVGAKHPELGMLPARPLRLSQESGTTTLRFGQPSGLDLLLLEGGAPSPGTQTSLFTGGFRFVLGDIASDGEGQLRWPNLAEGVYSMRVVHPGFWPGHAQVPTASGSEPTPVTIYRSGSVVLTLVSGGSAPLAGQALELEHIGLDEGPALWAALGLLETAETVSDGQGRIALENWPRGTYRWRAERPDSAAASGEFMLGAGANPELELKLP